MVELPIWQFVALAILAIPGIAYLFMGCAMLMTFLVAFTVAMVKS